MNIERSTVAVLVGAVIAVLAQIVIAPNIAILSAMPNIILAYVLVVAIVRPTVSVYVLAFVLGLVYDLLGHGPVGAMAFLLVLAAFGTSRAFKVLNNDTLFMPLTIFVVAALAIEVLYSVLLLGLGLSASPLEAFVYRSLPCALYDCIFGLIFYPLAMRFIAGGAPQQVETASPTSNAIHAPAAASVRSRARIARAKSRHR